MSSTWRAVTLKDVCTKITDGSHNPPKGIEFSDFIMLSSKNVGNDSIHYDNPRYLTQEDYIQENRRTQVQTDDILLTIVGTIGRVAVVPKSHKQFTLQRSVAVLKADQDLILPRFLMYTLQGMLDFMTDESRGVAQKGIYLKQLREFQIPIPPIAEQKQIVALLDETFESLDQAKANIEKNIENSKELLQSKLNEIFNHKGDGWEVKTLGELGKVCMCKRILKKQTLPAGDIPFYKIGTFGKSPNAYIDKETYDEYRTKYSFPKKGDILISASGTIGRRVIYDGEPAYFQDSNIVWLDNDEEFVLNDYLYQFYGVCDWNPSKGATISRLYNDDLRKISISYPAISEQRKLIEQMVKLNANTQKIIFQYHQKLEGLDELKKSILQKAFDGQLTSAKSATIEDRVLA